MKPPHFGVVCQQHCITKTLVTHRCPLSKHMTISQMQRKYGHPFPTTTFAANSCMVTGHRLRKDSSYPN